MKTALFNVLVLFAVLYSAGCGKNTDNRQADVKRDIENEEITGIKLPPDFPSEFTNPPGSKVLSVNIKKDGTDLMLQSDTGPEEIIAHYKKIAYGAGYEEQFSENGNTENRNEAVLMFVRQKDKRGITISISQSKGSGKSLISFFYKAG